MFLRSTLFFALLISSTALASGDYERTASGLLIPKNAIRAGSYSEFSGFEGDFCAANQVSESNVKQACFGRLRLQGQSSLMSRAFLLTDAAGKKALYVENEIPKVELKSVEFAILGPLNGAQISIAAEIGRARLAIDARGEVSAVELLTSKLGRIKIARP